MQVVYHDASLFGPDEAGWFVADDEGGVLGGPFDSPGEAEAYLDALEDMVHQLNAEALADEDDGD